MQADNIHPLRTCRVWFIKIFLYNLCNN